jgi:hypothetical protein
MPETQPPPLEPSEEFLARSTVARRVFWAKLWIVLVVVFIVAAGIAGWWWTVRLAGAAPAARYAWVQMLPDRDGMPGGRLVRAIVTRGNACPALMQDHVSVQMTIRPAPVRAAFPIVLCEAALAASSDAWLGTRRLPLRPSDPRNIVVLGDTGCRMVYYDDAPQRCTSGVDWPFAAIASEAAAVAAKSPSLVMHVGDFHYRENPCADDSSACGGSPYGDNWATWEEEFFKPAQPLLLAAPWIILRGNHENCARAGAGWLYFFAWQEPKYADACVNDRPPYNLSIGATQDRTTEHQARRRVLVVLDTADDRTSEGLKARCEQYERWINDIKWGDREVWLALHQPLWQRDARREPTDKQRDAMVAPGPCKNAATRSALDGIRARFDALATRRTVRLVLSGDTHLFEFFRPVDPLRPIQLVAGDGGTKLDQLEPQSAAGAGASAQDRLKNEMNRSLKSYGVDGIASAVADFGFVRLHLDGSTWTADLIGVKGEVLTSCGFSEAPGSSPPADNGQPCGGGLVAKQSAKQSTKQ